MIWNPSDILPAGESLYSDSLLQFVIKNPSNFPIVLIGYSRMNHVLDIDSTSDKLITSVLSRFQ